MNDTIGGGRCCSPKNYGSVDNDKAVETDAKQDSNSEDTVSYWNLLRSNRPFRLYLLSYVATLIGEWLTYIACISLIEELQRNSSQIGESKTAVSIFIFMTVFPCVLVAPFAGAWADTQDRRLTMICLNVVGAAIPAMYLLAIQRQSIGIVYATTFLKYTVAGLHEPNMWSMLPMLAQNEDYLQKATTLTEMTWSVMYTLSSAAGGLVVGMCGFRTCFSE